MKTAPTLIDAVYRASFRSKTCAGWKNNYEMRRALETARRFIVTEPMSCFMADLANESFIRAGTKLAPRLADSLRVQSRLPHESIWIEYYLRPYQRRAHALRHTPPPIDSELPWKEGWLIQQHPKIETACIMHLFMQDAENDPPHFDNPDGVKLWTFPFAFGWCCDESPLPWRCTVESRVPMKSGYIKTASAMIVGIADYDRDNVGCVHSPLITDPDERVSEVEYKHLLAEWVGVIRRVWALLATIDNLPLAYGTVRQSKGFLARGRIRKFLDHQTITLSIPGHKDTRVLARKMIAIVHRKRHEVRAFWRNDWRHPPSEKCNPHLWELLDANDADHIYCTVCRGRQVHVHKHERGDASLGYVTHDYKIKHEREEART